ncbi:MAG TPA: hypothetical protein VGL86_20045 [Polyangia bacterium]
MARTAFKLAMAGLILFSGGLAVAASSFSLHAWFGEFLALGLVAILASFGLLVSSVLVLIAVPCVRSVPPATVAPLGDPYRTPAIPIEPPPPTPSRPSRAIAALPLAVALAALFGSHPIVAACMFIAGITTAFALTPA